MQFFSSDIESGNEIFSCNQLEAFNSLPENDQRRVKRNQIDIEKDQQKPNPIQVQVKQVVKTEVTDTAIVAPSKHPSTVTAIKRILPLTKLLPGRKANPKTVTASVFKAISPDVKLLKTIPPTRPAPPTAIDSIKSKANVVNLASPGAQQVGKVSDVCRGPDSTNTAVRQKVITASLIQPRNGPSLLKNSVVNHSPAAETMNKAFFMFADNAPQLCCEYAGCGTDKPAGYMRLFNPDVNLISFCVCAFVRVYYVHAVWRQCQPMHTNKEGERHNNAKAKSILSILLHYCRDYSSLLDFFVVILFTLSVNLVEHFYLKFKRIREFGLRMSNFKWEGERFFLLRHHIVRASFGDASSLAKS